MTPKQRGVLIVAFAWSTSTLVGVISLALNASQIWSGMAISFGSALIFANIMTKEEV